MSKQLQTLLYLNDKLQALDMAEEMIFSARRAWPYDSRVQLELDREKAEIDAKRNQVLAMQYTIASSN